MSEDEEDDGARAETLCVCVQTNRRKARACLALRETHLTLNLNARHERELHSEVVVESCQMIQNVKYDYIVLKYEWLSKLVIFYNMYGNISVNNKSH